MKRFNEEVKISHLIRIDDIKHVCLKESRMYVSLFIDVGSEGKNILIETEIMENLDEIKRVYDEIINTAFEEHTFVKVDYTFKI